MAGVTGACCAGPALGPLTVSLLGASGAVWVAGLKPYSPYVLGGSFLLLCWGFWSRRRERVCAVSEGQRPPRSAAMLWIASVLWVGSLLTNLSGWLGT